MAQSKTEISSVKRRVFADPMSDAGFKLIYRNPENMLILINSILGENFASSVTMLDKEVQADRVLGKKSIFDFLCQTPKGEVIVEVQVEKDDSFAERLYFYSTYLVQEQYNRYRRKKILEEQNLQEIEEREKTLEGSDFRLVPVLKDKYVGGFTYRMHPVYVIAIVGFNLVRYEEEGRVRNEDVIRSIHLRDDISGELFTDKLNFTLVEIWRFRKKEKDLTSSSDRL
ncbi:MAG: PD-(D/E)XK nuclease family transposase, partial [Bacteroidales bacterium]|nr:PD-(D/E)XK nuclease family transposase [Bacteroidales bacterium]